MAYSDLRDGVGVRLETITALRVYKLAPDGEPEVPCAIVLPRAGQTRATIGYTSYPFRVLVLVTRADLPSAIKKMDDYLTSGTGGIRNAIEGDPQLAGHAQGLMVVEVQENGMFDWAGVRYYGASYLVDVIAA